MVTRILRHCWTSTRPLTYSVRCRYLSSIRSDGNESESERWRRVMSDDECGFTTSFEDADGNRIRPLRKPTDAVALRSKKGISKIDRGNYFVDFRRVKFFGGNGGDGCISMLHLYRNEFAGPDGGDGGNGAHVILKANYQVKSLQNIQALYKGESGEHGQGKDMIGKSGDHMIVEVPIGTLVKTEEGTIIADLDVDGSMFIAARGGAGGKGNHFFLSNENRHPRVCELGAKGDVNTYMLEMKTVAHAGFVGFPNAGKSTLLRAISRARPKVAAYPFTTLNPHVGIVQFDDYEQLAVADLPGLIEGAHKNHGLGINFLRHIERCVCLMYVLDLSAEEPWTHLDQLRFELEQYRPGLSKRPHAIIGNKIDAPNANDNLVRLRNHIAASTPDGELPLPVIAISAKFGTNINEFLGHLRGLYDMYNHPDDETEQSFIW